MRKLILFFTFFCSFTLHFSQEENDIFSRLSAMENNGKIWYNIDGYSVTSEVFNLPFNDKEIKKMLKKYQISENDVKNKSEKIPFHHIYVEKEQELGNSLKQDNHYYLVENNDKTISVIWFIKIGKTDLDTEAKLVNAIIENKIPKENFVSLRNPVINFTNTSIELSNSCYWTFLNTIQCPYEGEINWSIHRDLDDAKNSVTHQLNITKSRKNMKVISEETVKVNFLNTDTEALRVIYKITGVNGLLVKTSGGTTLTVYYISEKVNNKNISCVMSFWNNDKINPNTKLPPLLEKFLQLK